MGKRAQSIGPGIVLALFFATSVSEAVTTRYKDLDTSAIQSRVGSTHFRLRVLQDVSSDLQNHILFLGVSSDGTERHEMFLLGHQLIVRRYFGGCLQAVFNSPSPFQIGQWSQVELAWNGASTRLWVDGQELTGGQLMATQDMTPVRPGIRLGLEKNYEISDFQSDNRRLLETDPSDQALVDRTACPRLGELLKEPAQEIYRNVQLHHFPDAASRDKIKSYLALLPEGFAQSFKHVVYVEDARAPKNGEGGAMDGRVKTVYLKGSYAGDSDVFFHEAAHAYDYQQHLALGVPEEKSEWVAIAGVHCYYKGADMKDFSDEFGKTHVTNGFLGGQGGQCPPEDVAEWVAAAYTAYLQNAPMRDLLDPSGRRYSPKNKQKLDLLLRKGFLSQTVYDKITS